MSTSLKYGLDTTAPETTQATVVQPLDKPSAQAFEELLGTCVARPFQRDGKGDFATKSGLALIEANIEQILGTISQGPRSVGECRWRPEFGCRLQRLRHQNNTEVLEEIGRIEVAQAIERWEPRCRLREVQVTRFGTPSEANQNGLKIRIVWDLMSRNGKSVIAKGIKTTVSQ